MKWLVLVLLLLVGCSAQKPAQPVECGTETRTFQGGVNAAGRQCLWDAHTKGQAAVFEVTRYTLEGDPVILKLWVGTKIQASVDTRQDQFSAEEDRKVTLYTCTSLKRITDPEPAFRLDGCTGGEATALQI